MPVYDHSYRHLERALPLPSSRWLVIARLGVTERLASRWFDGLLVISLLPFLFYAIRIFVEARFPDVVENLPQLAVQSGSFLVYLRTQMMFAFLVTIFAGSGVISGDLRTRALPLYLSKPIGRGDYVLGKLLVPSTLIAMVTLVPAELLLLLRVLTSEGDAYLVEGPLLAVRIGVTSLVIILTMSAIMLALSSLTRSTWLPGLGFAIAYLFGRAFAGLLRLVFDSDYPLLLSVRENIVRVADGIFGTPPATGPSWILSLVVLLGIAGLSGLVLHLRIRAVDVVSG